MGVFIDVNEGMAQAIGRIIVMSNGGQTRDEMIRCEITKCEDLAMFEFTVWSGKRARRCHIVIGDRDCSQLLADAAAEEQRIMDRLEQLREQWRQLGTLTEREMLGESPKKEE
jgi:hypothetical protein